MRVTHTFQRNGRCAVNPDWLDHYRITVTLDGSGPTLLIEDILDYAERLLTAPTLQEQFTQALADALKASVTTECKHKGDVLTVVEASCAP